MSAQSILPVELKASAPATDSWDLLLLGWLTDLFKRRLSADQIDTYENGLGANLLDALLLEPRYAFGALLIRAAVLGNPAEVLAAHLGKSFTEFFEDLDDDAGPLPSSRDQRQQTRAPHLWVELTLLTSLIRSGAGHQAELDQIENQLLDGMCDFVDRVAKSDRTGLYTGALLIVTAYLTIRRNQLIRNAGEPSPVTDAT